MSDGEEMTDMSQVMTQSGSITPSGSITQSGMSHVDSDQPWGKIDIFKVIAKRLGVRVCIASYAYEKLRTVELVNEKTTFGRTADCNLTDLIDTNKSNEISSVHFTIIKHNLRDAKSPVFLEDSSKNGIYFQEQRRNSGTKVPSKERIDPKVKRRILAHKDIIYVEKRPSICLEYQSYQTTRNDLPADINKEYHIGRELGNGACGTVYLAQNRRTCQLFALKYTNSDRNENNVAIILKEVNILQKLEHPCILKLFKTQTYIDSVAIFIDFMRGGDLFARINQVGPFTESLAKFVFYQVCCGIQYLHAQNVIHRDLKPENILLATTDRYTLVKVSDFGLSKCVSKSKLYMQTQCGTRGYLAPEVSTSKYTNKVDIWSLGVVLYNCFTGRFPYKFSGTLTNMEQYEMDFSHMKTVSIEGKNIVYETLQMDANRRPSASELLNQRDWLSESDKYVQKALDFMKNPKCE